MLSYSEFNITNLNNGFWIVSLGAARFYGAMALCPIFSDNKLTKMLKISLAFMFSFMVFPYFYSLHPITLPISILMKLVLIIKELLFGCLLSYLLGLPFWLIENIGNLIDLQRGEQFGASINQTTNNPSSSISKLLLQGFITYFVSMNWLLYFISVIFTSFKLFSINTIIPTNPLFSLNNYIGFFSGFFYWVIILALPITFTMLLLDMVLALISSFVPQLNVTILAMPIKSLIALFLLIFFTNELYHIVLNKFFNILNIPFSF